MLEMIESLATVVALVPVMVAVLLGAIYGLGEVFNVFSAIGRKTADGTPGAVLVLRLPPNYPVPSLLHSVNPLYSRKSRALSVSMNTLSFGVRCLLEGHRTLKLPLW